METSTDEFMSLALEQAKIALASDEVPVGCVIVDPTCNTVIATGHNKVFEYLYIVSLVTI